MYAPNLDMEALVQALVAWYQSQNLEVERLPGQSILLQCRERQEWRKFLGMAMGLQVELNYSNPGLMVTISATKWVDKAVVGGIAVATIATGGIGLPLAIPAAFGYWQQKKLPDRSFAFIQAVVASQVSSNHVTDTNKVHQGTPIPPPPADWNGGSDPREAKVTLESLVESNFKMKSSLGNSSMPGSANSNSSSPSTHDPAPGSESTVGSTSTTGGTVVCPKCGKPVAPGKRFCGMCGSPLNLGGAADTIVNAPANAAAPHADGMKSSGQTASGRTTLDGVIVVIDDGGQRIPLPNKSVVLIGRRGVNRSSFPDLDLAPYKGETCGVSFEHARMLLKNGQVMLEDLDAPNCTWLGEKQLLPGAPCPLQNADKVRFGNLSATVLIP